MESFRLLLPYLDDADVKTAAASAVVNAAEAVATGPDYAVVKPVLEKISKTADPSLVDRVENLKRVLAATESAMKGKNR